MLTCSAWEDAVGIFWLTRLLRADADVRIRCDAAALLATLVHPRAAAMRAAVLTAWPEGGSAMLRFGLSRCQPAALAAAALEFAAVSMASSSRDIPRSEPDPDSSVRRLQRSLAPICSLSRRGPSFRCALLDANVPPLHDAQLHISN